MNHIALSRNDFDTLDPIHIETGLGIVVAVCLILAVALVVLVVMLSNGLESTARSVQCD